MEDEINLHEYIRAIARYWKWITGVTLISAIVAGAISLFMPPTYEAAALIVITRPKYSLQFDPRVETVENVQPAFKAYPQLATSDEIVQLLLLRLDPPPQGIETLSDLRGMMEAKAETDPSLVRLAVRAADAAEAARIANAWAELFVSRANEIYGAEEAGASFFETQLQQSQKKLEAAEQALVEFEAQNRSNILNNQLSSYRQIYADHLADQRAIIYLIQDIRGLRDQLAGQPADQTASLADELTLLFLQIKAFEAQTNTSLQLQIGNTDSLSRKSVREQIAFLDSLANTLETKSAEITSQLTTLEPQILDLQKQLQKEEIRRDYLVSNRNIEREIYLTLVRKAEEARIAAQDTSGQVRLASHAVVPEEPAGPRKVWIVAIAALLGWGVSVAVISVVEWWKSGEASAKIESAH